MKSKPKSKEAPEAEINPEIKAEPVGDRGSKPEAGEETPANLTPQLVKRLHELLYEQLGREEAQAVENLDRAAKNKPKKKE